MASTNIHGEIYHPKAEVEMDYRYNKRSGSGEAYYSVTIGIGPEDVTFFLNPYQFETFVQGCESIVECEG